MNYNYVTIDRVFAKFIRDVGIDFSEGDLVEWTGEALELIGAVKQYEQAVSFVEVKNHQIDMPLWLHSITQIARNTNWCGAKESDLCPQKVVEALTTEQTPAIPVALNCQGMPKNEYELAYYRPYFDLKYEYQGWTGSSYYRQNYRPVRLSSNNFFDSLVCKENQHTSIYSGVEDTYTIIRGETIRFSFKEGSVAVAFLRQMVDPETGYPMIPDHASYTAAINYYLTFRIFSKQYCNGREGAKGRMDDAEAKWHWYCKQAGNLSLMPTEDEYQNIINQRSYLVPQTNRYYGFFGNLHNREDRKFLDPNQRNHNGGHFIGN